jgi:uncharacterized membrane protein
MNITADLVPDLWLWLSHLLFGALVLYLVRTTPWHRLQERPFIHVLAAFTVGLLILWAINVSASEGLHYHFLGATLFTLMFGWPFGLWGLIVTVFGATAYGLGDWHSVSLNALLLAVLPVYLSFSVLRMQERYLPDHFFIYVYGSGFFGAALVVGITAVASGLTLVVTGAYPLQRVFDHFLAFTPLIMFAEAFLTGMLMTLAVVFRPDWVATFSDERYIKGK